MNAYFQSVQNYLKNLFAKDTTIGVLVMVGVVAIIVVIVVLIQAAQPKIVYQPAVACDLLSEEEAKEMLGQNVLHQPASNPTLKDNVATSKCGYTDTNPEQNHMIVAADAVRSSVNDDGTTKNTREFATAKLNSGTQTVDHLGDKAFFNPELGQLNILSGRNWIIISFGAGTSPKNNSLDKAVELAQKVIADPILPTF